MYHHRERLGARERSVATAPQIALFFVTVVTLGHAAGCEPRLDPLADQRVLFGRFDHLMVDGSGTTHGLDLDGRVSDGLSDACTEQFDFTSPVTGVRGVDNQYATFLLPLLVPASSCGGWLVRPPCPRQRQRFGDAILEEQLAVGVGLLGLEVRVEHRAGGRSPPRVFVTLSELIAEGALDIEDGALAPGARLRSRSIETAEAVVDGRILRVTFERMLIPLGTTAGLQPIEGVSLELRVDESGSLTHGELGARVTVGTVLDVARLVTGDATLDEEFARSISQPDLDPNASGECQRVSIGLGVELVPFEARAGR